MVRQLFLPANHCFMHSDQSVSILIPYDGEQGILHGMQGLLRSLRSQSRVGAGQAQVRLTGMTAPMVLDGAMNGIAFRAYVEQVLVPIHTDLSEISKRTF